MGSIRRNFWYAHACCSAGANDKTSFADLLNPDSDIALTLQGIAKAGAMVAPLPTALYLAIRDRLEHSSDTSSRLSIIRFATRAADNLQRRHSVRRSTGGYFSRGRWAALFVAFIRRQRPTALLTISNLSAFNKGGNTERAMLYSLLAARDVYTTVILGDPVVCPMSITGPASHSKPKRSIRSLLRW